MIMKIIPKINENPLDRSVVFQANIDSDKSLKDQVGSIEDRGIESGDKINFVLPEGNIQEYRITDMNRYDNWKDIFIKGVHDEKWRTSPFIKKDIYGLIIREDPVPFTDSDLKAIETAYLSPGFITQDALGAYGVILKNALVRRDAQSENMKVKISELDNRLAVLAQELGIKKKKSIDTTMDQSRIARYLVHQGRNSWAGELGNMMEFEENEKVIGLMLQKEISSILKGGSENPGITNKLYELIQGQTDTKTQKDYIPVNALILYAVLIKNIDLIKIAINAKNQPIDIQKQGRIKGKFTPRLGTMLNDLSNEEGMEKIKSVLASAGLIQEHKIIPKLENKSMGKTIIISERQAQLLSLLRLSETSDAIKATKDAGYTTPDVGGYTAQEPGGTDHAAELEKKRNSGRPAVDATKDHFKPADKREKSLIVDKDKVCDSKKLNDYFVKEGVDYYKVLTKKELVEQLAQNA
jgi:hypothetical protein